MMGRRGVRDAGLARHRAQGQPGKAIALEHPLGRLEQGVAQRAVVVRRVFARAGGPGRASFSHRPRRRGVIRRAWGAGSGSVWFSCHFGLIGHDFDTVKILLDGQGRFLYPYLYDVKINQGASDA